MYKRITTPNSVHKKHNALSIWPSPRRRLLAYRGGGGRSRTSGPEISDDPRAEISGIWNSVSREMGSRYPTSPSGPLTHGREAPDDQTKGG